MDVQKIAASVDHTLLAPTATWPEILSLCDEAMEYGTASVCVPACHVRDAVVYVDGKIPVCTAIGFPNGNNTTGAKLFEAKTAIMDGASEINMMVNLGHVKEGRFDKVFSEISGIKAMVGEKNVLKVIVEMCMLSEEEKVRMCVLVSQTGADYLKTSTGFASGDVTPEDIGLIRRHAEYLKIDVGSGIYTLDDAQAYLDLGVRRLGTGRIIRLLKEKGIKGKNAPDRFAPETV